MSTLVGTSMTLDIRYSQLNLRQGRDTTVYWNNVTPFFRFKAECSIHKKCPKMCNFRLSKCPSSVFKWRGTKDFSYLIGVNFTDPKTGRCAWTNQSSSQGQSCHSQVISALRRDLEFQFKHGVDCEVEDVDRPNTTHKLVIVWYVTL